MVRSYHLSVGHQATASGSEREDGRERERQQFDRLKKGGQILFGFEAAEIRFVISYDAVTRVSRLPTMLLAESFSSCLRTLTVPEMSLLVTIHDEGDIVGERWS